MNIQKRFTDFDLSMHEKELLVKRKLERLKFTNEKSVNLEINDANDGDNNSNVNLVAIATVKIENNNNQI